MSLPFNFVAYTSSLSLAILYTIPETTAECLLTLRHPPAGEAILGESLSLQHLRNHKPMGPLAQGLHDCKRMATRSHLHRRCSLAPRRRMVANLAGTDQEDLRGVRTILLSAHRPDIPPMLENKRILRGQSDQLQEVCSMYINGNSI